MLHSSVYLVKKEDERLTDKSMAGAYNPLFFNSH